MRVTPRRVASLGVAACLLGLASRAGAEDTARPRASERALELQKAVEAHLTGTRDAAALAADVQAIAKYAPQASEAADRSLLLNLVGRAIKVNDEPLRKACLQAFQDMKDPKAWDSFGFLLVMPDLKKMEPMLEETIKTCGVLTPEGAALKLIDLYRNSDALPACVACLKALSKYKKSTQRTKILAEMVDEVRSIRPGVYSRVNPYHTVRQRTGEAARARFEGLSGPVVESANALTGQSVGTVDDWSKTTEDLKSHLEDCFLEPLVAKAK